MYSKLFGHLTVGESVDVACEPANPFDAHAVSVKKDGHTIGHVPRNTSRILFTFLSLGGTVECQVVNPMKYGKGLKVPCIYKTDR